MGADGLHPQILMEQDYAIARTVLIIFERLWELGEVFCNLENKKYSNLKLQATWHHLTTSYSDREYTHGKHFQEQKGQKSD